jgi:lysophospholipase L1-like esterase
MFTKAKKFTFFISLALLIPLFKAKAEESILKDVSGDGRTRITAFGDSLTFGVGDGTQPGDVVSGMAVPFTEGTKGYPARLRKYLGVPVDNEGLPGEQFSTAGVNRFPASFFRTDPDLIIIMEGANDARQSVPSAEVQRVLQKAVNVVVAAGRTPVLATLPTPCCEHGFLAASSSEYSVAIKSTGAINDIRIADLRRAWKTSCVNQDECELYNIPEGLHPNTKGYDVVAQTIAGAILGIDVFSSGGAGDLAAAIGIPVDAVFVKPETDATMSDGGTGQ